MKTLHIQNDTIQNMTVGSTYSEVEGFTYEVVEDNAFVGIGFIRSGNEWIDPRPPVPPFVPVNWVGFNQGLLAIEGYKTWAKAIKKSNTDDELLYQTLVISVGIQNIEQAQFAYDSIQAKPAQSVRDEVNALAVLNNIPLTF